MFSLPEHSYFFGSKQEGCPYCDFIKLKEEKVCTRKKIIGNKKAN
jgi:hypothetical protein